jgi:putative transposase
LVGYALDARMTQQLVMQALFRAVAAKRPGKGLLHHSDRGSQYCSQAYQKLLRQFGMQVSKRWPRVAGQSFGFLK